MQVQATPVERLCNTRSIITVNGMFPGPTLQVRNGDALTINVVNRCPYNITIHWHGVRQMRTAWADGPEFVTQCPIRPGGSYTYRFDIEDQEGTLWWHAHSAFLRATVYGGLVIYPRNGSSYPFEKPGSEFPVILGEWWNSNIVDEAVNVQSGGAPSISDAYTINGQPGDLYNCSSQATTTIPVSSGQTTLLRVVNAALNTNMFFSVAGHAMTVVGADASYTKPFSTSVLMLGPGQTTDVLVAANQPPARYYMAARAYSPAVGVQFDNTTTTAILEYRPGGQTQPVLPCLPEFNDTSVVTDFTARMRSHSAVDVPDPVDVHLLFTIGLGVTDNGNGSAASMNNVSFLLPSFSILQAHHLRVPGVFTQDFPVAPPVQFDYTGTNISRDLWAPVRGTKVLPLRYGCRVQLVLQGTGIVVAENHPIHVHGYDFYVLAEGFGNFDPAADAAKFNLADPPQRNTVTVPVNGWAVVRFVADNPGVWLVHCHIDAHSTWGLAMAFVVEDGVGELQTLGPPPPDLPAC
ncbi:hypothetical protein Taro_044172 [Colocasia esculenta]|uniref:Laccase n=1 Tax=Colocasia esculenta TaxID=4460 RepID=A0A843WTC4_COLES|nr:hypothetical protein [Colocasia esculenta]